MSQPSTITTTNTNDTPTTKQHIVTLHQYDLSNGMCAAMSQQLTGRFFPVKIQF
jgi:hypothetical protein